MIRSLKWHVGTLLAIAALTLFAGRVGAQTSCFGDCNASNSLTASDIGRINSTILRCAPCPGDIPGGIANGCAAFAAGCTAADFNTDGCLRASELARANQNILRFQPSGCAPTPTVAGGGSPSPTPTATGGVQTPRCGDGEVQPPEECDNGGACFTGTSVGALCTDDSQCPGGGAGSCRPAGGDGCANNCTNESQVTFTFSGAICKGGAKNGQVCKFKSTCQGGVLNGKLCATVNDCAGDPCLSECGADSAGCFGDGTCSTGTVGAQCYVAQTGETNSFCQGGASNGKVCGQAADCGGSPCVNPCGAAGVCLNKSRAALVQLSLAPIPVGPLIGNTIVRYGKVGANGLIPVASRASDTVFEPVRVPGLVCACVRGGEDPKSHGPGNSGSGIINCGNSTIANDVTLAQDHNTTKPNVCTGGAKVGQACLNRCSAGGTRAGLPCLSNSECPGATASQRLCNSVADCSGAGLCNSGNGPGVCTGGGASAGRACYDNTQCASPGVCSGKCTAGANLGAACSCTGTARACENTTACGTGGYCAVTGQGGGLCMGPPKFCVGGSDAGKACYANNECSGGTCPGTGKFLAKCSTDTDCPGSLCASRDDDTCTAQDPVPPAGSGLKACLEQRVVCTVGSKLGQPCTTSADCGAGGTCGATCNAQTPHPGVCNSPAHLTLTGAGGKGSALLLNTIAIGTISDGGTCALAAMCLGGAKDLQQCQVAGDCPGGTCATAACRGTCASGTNAGQPCLTPADCVGAICTPGPNFKQSCSSDEGCAGGQCLPINVYPLANTNPVRLGSGQGFDGIPCSADDAPGVRGVPNTIPQTTATSSTFVIDAGNVAGQQLIHKNCIFTANPASCLTSSTGTAIDCNALTAGTPNLTGLTLASTFATIDGTTGDAAVATFLSAR